MADHENMVLTLATGEENSVRRFSVHEALSQPFDHLGWREHFAHVYALDLFTTRLPDKAAMIGRLLADQAIPRDAAIYIGDRSEDGESADANGLPFIAVTWGYGSLTPAEMRAEWLMAPRPERLSELLLAD
jgi:phosphoglycolate phosphatase